MGYGKHPFLLYYKNPNRCHNLLLNNNCEANIRMQNHGEANESFLCKCFNKTSLVIGKLGSIGYNCASQSRISPAIPSSCTIVSRPLALCQLGNFTVKHTGGDWLNLPRHKSNNLERRVGLWHSQPPIWNLHLLISLFVQSQENLGQDNRLYQDTVLLPTDLSKPMNLLQHALCLSPIGSL